MIVEDDERILRVVGDMLTPNGYEVLLARDMALKSHKNSK